MADLGILKNFFEPYYTTLQQTSYDRTNEKYLCQSQEKVINFDEYTQANAQKSKCSAKKSFDALYFHHKDFVYCVEFKNQKYSDIDSDDIREKFTNGIFELGQVFKAANVAITNYIFYIFVVFQKPKTEKELNAFHIRFAGNEILYGLDTKKFKESLAQLKSFKAKTGYGEQFRRIYQSLFNHESAC